MQIVIFKIFSSTRFEINFLLILRSLIKLILQILFYEEENEIYLSRKNREMSYNENGIHWVAMKVLNLSIL